MSAIKFSDLGNRFLKFGKEMEFAQILALTWTAIDGKKAVQEKMDKEFTLRNRWARNGIRIKPATKKEPWSEVFSKDWFMRQQETGAQRKSPDTGPLERPVNIRLALGKTEQQRVPKVKKVLKMRLGADQAKPFIVRHTRTKTVKRRDKTKARKSYKFTGVYVRTSDQRLPLSLLYVLKPRSQKIKKKPFFEKTVFRAYDKSFVKNLQKAEERALKTAFR